MSESNTPDHVPPAWIDEHQPARTATGTPAGSPAPPQRSEPLLTPITTTSRKPTSTTWQGWAFFGAFIMALLGLIALFDKSYFAVRANNLLVLTNYTAWGWVHLVAGVVAVAAGLGVVLSGRPWSRYTAMVVAGLSAVVNLGFLSASPVWSTIVIALDVVVIYALAVHGWELDRS
ncbi:MAG: DUF7144 family membrane protein [Kineosporiaceae bacterium]